MARSAPLPDHYGTLGVARSATADQIRRAYRRLARELHPDVNRAADAAARFSALQNAYSVLSNRGERAAYNRALDAAAAAQPSSRPGVAHYSWRNVATDATPDADAPPERTDLDEMYDAFFGGQES